MNPKTPIFIAVTSLLVAMACAALSGTQSFNVATTPATAQPTITITNTPTPTSFPTPTPSPTPTSGPLPVFPTRQVLVFPANGVPVPPKSVAVGMREDGSFILIDLKSLLDPGVAIEGGLSKLCIHRYLSNTSVRWWCTDPPVNGITQIQLKEWDSDKLPSLNFCQVCNGTDSEPYWNWSDSDLARLGLLSDQVDAGNAKVIGPGPVWTEPSWGG